MTSDRPSVPLLLFHSCRIRDAVSYLTNQVDLSRNSFSEESEESLHLLFRGLFELDLSDELRSRVETLKDRSLLNPEKVSTQTLVNLGSGYVYLGKMTEAHHFYTMALSKIASSDKTEILARAMIGKLNALRALNGAEITLQELKNFLIKNEECLSPQNRVSASLLKANLLGDLDDDVGALNEFWRCYSFLEQSKSLYQYYYLMFYLYEAHRKLNEKSQARVFFELVKKGIDNKELCWLSKVLNQNDFELDPTVNEIVYQKREGRILLTDGKWIELKRQNILRAVFEALTEKNGNPLSMSELAKVIWNVDYSPKDHENKIYVTIRRLRQLMEPDALRPQLINKDHRGYFLTIPVRTIRSGEAEL